MSEVTVQQWQETGSFTLNTFLGYVEMARKHNILDALLQDESVTVLVPPETANAFKSALSKAESANTDAKINAVLMCGCCDCHKGGGKK